jgi:hypothetical protein
MDVIKLDVPLFIRILELAREEVKQDVDLHDIAEAVIELSKDGVATMADYDTITAHMKNTVNRDISSEDQELDRIQYLGGVKTRAQMEYQP